MSESVKRRAGLQAAHHRFLAYAADLVARGELPYRVYEELNAAYFPKAKKKKGSKEREEERPDLAGDESPGEHPQDRR